MNVSEIRIHRIKEVGSTNDHVKTLTCHKGQMIVAVAEKQTAGRGQGGNKWESEDGKNLMFSIKAMPESLPAGRQFALLAAGALSVCEALSAYGPGFTVKWPNDIYHGDHKISGTLIETRLRGGRVEEFVLGIGVNVNQQRFVSDAPNPISLYHVVGSECDREILLHKMLELWCRYYRSIIRGEDHIVMSRYRCRMYRATGQHPFEDADGVFKAEIMDVASDGRLVLRTAEGDRRTYEFKQVKYIINPTK